MNTGSEKKVELAVAAAVIGVFALVILASFYASQRYKKSPPESVVTTVSNRQAPEPYEEAAEQRLAPHFVLPVEGIPTHKEVADSLAARRQKQKVFEARVVEKKKKADVVRKNAEEDFAASLSGEKSETVRREESEEEKNEQKKRRMEAIAQINAGHYFLH